MQDILSRIEAINPKIVAWRRELHRNPELSHQEKETSAYILRELERLGLKEIRTGVGGYGLVAEIDSGRPGKAIGIRADMDALPIQEEVECDFASRNPGVMHACGHDAHTAMLLGAAEVLRGLGREGRFSGKVRLLFQPAEECINEEGKSGGRRMVEEGVMEGLDAVIAQHISPKLEVGGVSFQRGVITASSDSFELIVRGRNAHGATPDAGVDAIVVASAIIQSIQQLVSRTISPMETGVVTIGTIQGGTAANILAGEVRMNGTIRALNESVRKTLTGELHRLVTGIASALRGEAELRVREGYPVGINDPALSDFAEASLRELLGDGAIHPEIGPSTGAEDFAFMCQLVPGVMMRLGVKDPAWAGPSFAHTQTFRIDERSLPIGTAALVSVAANYLRCG